VRRSGGSGERGQVKRQGAGGTEAHTSGCRWEKAVRVVQQGRRVGGRCDGTKGANVYESVGRQG
jgi:hypothetical protein